MAGRTFEDIQKLFKEHEIEYVDLKTLDLVGRLHNITLPVERFNKKIMSEGIGFDGSSYGFVKVENSDMVQIPDLDTACLDPFRAHPTMSFFVTVHQTDDERTRYPHDVRYIAQKAEEALRKTGVADDSYWGPEFEFHILDKASFANEPMKVGYKLRHGDNISAHNAYHSSKPHDAYAEFRDEACSILKALGIEVKYHHHEVGEGQQEIEVMFEPLIKTADNAVTIKYVLFNLAEELGLKLTFMPKPIYKEAGNGWHVHQYLVKQGKNAFYEKDGYANMNEMSRHYIGGILKHARSLSALANPSTNSYKRLVRGYEAPVSITYGRANRTSAIRIPKYVSDEQYTRMEYRSGDATANPYIFISAMLMAGIDGIENKYDPEKLGYGPFDKKNIDSVENIEYLPTSLGEALDSLEADNDYLKRNDVFDDKFIQNWVEKKRVDIEELSNRPHPYEYEMYFDL